MSQASPHITITDPDDPDGMPAYDGPADEAWRTLDVGTYRGVDSSGRPGTLHVRHTPRCPWTSKGDA